MWNSVDRFKLTVIVLLVMLSFSSCQRGCDHGQAHRDLGFLARQLDDVVEKIDELDMLIKEGRDQ
jgi:hypothetical protein